MYKTIIRPVLFQFDPELVHDSISVLLSSRLFAPFWGLHHLYYKREHPELKTSFCGIECQHPIGLAAGFDKDATMFPRLHNLGFSFIEIGTVTGEPQSGNPKKRLFRLPADRALINRMGFNNGGSERAAFRLSKASSPIPIGGNIGKTKVVPLGDEAILDYEKSFLALREHIDYLVVNVSSPNTPGLRSLQDKEPLCNLLNHLNQLNAGSDLPILLKIAPDLTEQQLEEIVDVVEETKIPGVIATNTTISRDDLKTDPERVMKMGAGGLSGAPVFDASTVVLRFLRKNLPKEVDLIGVGGIFNGQDAYSKIKAGACAVQLYTGFIYRGPSCVFQIQSELAALLKRDGFKSVKDAIGVELDS